VPDTGLANLDRQQVAGMGGLLGVLAEQVDHLREQIPG
jgi:hypothetical protein